MSSKLEFTATVEKFSHKGGWHFVRLTQDLLEELRKLAGKNGNVPILATVGGTTWKTTIMSMGEQQWFFALGADVRKTENISEGDAVVVKITPDFTKL